MIVRVFSAALVAGFLAACVAAALQAVLTTPLIHEAEMYERAAPAARTGSGLIHLAHAPSGHEPGAADESREWQPGPGLPRFAFTALATLVGAVGYALLLTAAMLAAGAEPTVGRALSWAIGGFVAVSLAPAVGLAPELPGMGGEALHARQAWWVLTALGTGAGLYLMAVVRTPLAVAAGLLAIVLPHAISVPSAGDAGSVPASLAAQFAARSIALSAAFWAALGLSLGWVWPRLDRASAV